MTPPPRRGSMLPALITGMIVGGALLWCGHYFWPTKSQLAPNKSMVSSLPLTDTSLGKHTIATIAAESVKSVVNIDTRQTVEMPRRSEQFNWPFNRFLDSEDVPQRRLEKLGSGSGVIIRADGLIATNNHVVSNATEIKIVLNDKRTFVGKVIGRDKPSDLALVKVNAKNLPVAKFGSSEKLRPGDWAIAIGSPLGLSHTVTLGIISGLARNVGALGPDVQFIQTDAAINPGNSGGPLLNIDGEVVGINTAVSGQAQNIGFAIPVNRIQAITKELLENGRIERPYVGIQMLDLTPTIADQLGLENDTGVLIARVPPDTPGERAGLRTGDMILSVNGTEIKSSKEVQNIVRKLKPGDKMEVKIARDDRERSMTISVADMPETEENL